MTIKELHHNLVNSRLHFLDEIVRVDLESDVYFDPLWKAKDILVNIGFWEHQGALSLNAFANGKQHSTPDFSEATINEINAINVKKFANASHLEIMEYFEKGREEMEEALLRLQDDDTDKLMMCPWKTMGTVEHFIEQMIIHEQDHLADILFAINKKDQML